jgi:hypothetical protein
MYVLQGKAWDTDLGRLVGNLERETKCKTREAAHKMLKKHLEKTKETFPFADHFIIGVIERE